MQVYDQETNFCIAICTNSSDAEQIASALNLVPRFREIIREMRIDKERFMRLYGPPERYEGS